MIVTVNKNSWHYRWLMFITDNFRDAAYRWTWKDPKSICTYFWTFVFNNLWALFVSILVVAGSTIAAAVVLSPIWGGLMYYWGYGDGFLFLPIAVYGFATILSVFLYIVSKSDVINSRIAQTCDNVSNNKKVGIVVGSFVAVKNKVCPMIEYEK